MAHDVQGVTVAVADSGFLRGTGANNENVRGRIRIEVHVHIEANSLSSAQHSQLRSFYKKASGLHTFF